MPERRLLKARETLPPDYQFFRPRAEGSVVRVFSPILGHDVDVHRPIDERAHPAIEQSASADPLPPTEPR